jgi:hypothetical protein
MRKHLAFAAAALSVATLLAAASPSPAEADTSGAAYWGEGTTGCQPSIAEIDTSPRFLPRVGRCRLFPAYAIPESSGRLEGTQPREAQALTTRQFL